MRLVTALVCLLLGGCVTDGLGTKLGLAPPTPAENARKAIDQGNWMTALHEIEKAMDSGDTKIRAEGQQLAERPGVKAAILARATEAMHEGSRGTSGLAVAEGHLESIRKSRLFSAADADALARTLNDAVRRAIEDDTSTFDISDARRLTVLNNDASVRLLLESALRKSNQVRFRDMILRFYEAEPRESVHRNRIETALAVIPFAPEELKRGQVARLFPSFASAQLAKIIVPVAITTDPPRRLLEEDLVASLGSKSPGLTVSRGASPRGIEIVIRELELRESRIPVNQQTRTVANSQIDARVRSGDLPYGASMLYDVRHGGKKIDYAYEVVVKVDGRQVEDRLLRSQVSSAFHQCTNLRYRTTGGRVRQFEAMPNSSVSAFCYSGGGPTDDTALQRYLADSVAQGILETRTVSSALARPGA